MEGSSPVNHERSSMKKNPTIVIHIPAEILNLEMIDQRPQNRGMVFGKVSKVCKQYGVSIEIAGELGILKAKRHLMQKFMEPLHFSGFPYAIID